MVTVTAARAAVGAVLAIRLAAIAKATGTLAVAPVTLVG
jgi:hypothetical protein